MSAKKTVLIIVLLALSLYSLAAITSLPFKLGHMIESLSGAVNLSFIFYTGASESSTLEIATEKTFLATTDKQYVGRLIGKYSNGTTSSASVNYIFYWTPFKDGDASINYTMTVNPESTAGTEWNWSGHTTLPTDAIGSFARTLSIAKGEDKTLIFANLYLTFNDSVLTAVPGDYVANFVTRVVTN